MVCCGLLVFIYAAAFVKAWRGTRYRVVVVQITLLFWSNIFYIGRAFGNWQVNLCYLYGYSCSEEQMFWRWAIAVGLMTVADACFGVAHWLLAIFYLRIAKNMRH